MRTTVSFNMRWTQMSPMNRAIMEGDEDFLIQLPKRPRRHRWTYADDLRQRLRLPKSERRRRRERGTEPIPFASFQLLDAKDYVMHTACCTV